MTEEAASPSSDESLRACFLATDEIVDGLMSMMAFSHRVQEQGSEELRREAQSAVIACEFMALFLGCLQRALADLRLVTPEDRR